MFKIVNIKITQWKSLKSMKILRNSWNLVKCYNIINVKLKVQNHWNRFKCYKILKIHQNVYKSIGSHKIFKQFWNMTKLQICEITKTKKKSLKSKNILQNQFILLKCYQILNIKTNVAKSWKMLPNHLNLAKCFQINKI